MKINKNVYEDIQSTSQMLAAAGALFAAHKINQVTYIRLQNLIKNAEKYKGTNMKFLYTQWNTIIDKGKQEMKDSQWDEFRDRRWSTTNNDDPIIQRQERERMQYEENLKRAWEKSHEETPSVQDEIEESKVDTDDYFETTAKTIKRPKKRKDDDDEEVHYVKPRWAGKLKTAMGIAKKIDSTLKKNFPEPANDIPGYAGNSNDIEPAKNLMNRRNPATLPNPGGDPDPNNNNTSKCSFLNLTRT